MEIKSCFVIMPFGEKTDAAGAAFDFDEIFDYLIAPAAQALQLNVIRSDRVTKAGWVHAEMLEHLRTADAAIVDITTLNPNVFYELGVRHVLRRGVTVLIRKKGTPVPFNIQGFRVLDYGLGLREAADAKKLLTEYLDNGLKTASNDSLVYSVFPNLKVST